MFKKTESFDDIVFENRNKAYGAYDLRKRYSRRGSIALAVSLFILFVSVGAPLIAGILNKNAIERIINTTDSLILIDLDDKPEVIPLPPTPPPAPKPNEVKFTIPDIVDSLKDLEKEMLSTGDAAAIGNKALDDTTGSNTTFVDPIPDLTDDEIFEPTAPLSEKPMFPGGDRELLQHIAKKTIYPQEAIDNEIEGAVYIRFAVMKTGMVEHVQIFKSSGESLLDEEALRVVKQLPQWTPGKINGNPVNVWFLVPVKFKLTRGN